MKKAILFLTIITMISCQNTEEDRSFSYFDNAVAFSLKNDEGDDLLDPTNVNALDTSSFKVYYIIDGVKTRYSESHLVDPKGFRVFEHENEYRIAIFTDFSSDRDITIIEWFENDVDTIEVLYNKTANSVLKQDIWLNGEHIWEYGNNTEEAFFVLTK
jgi:hypothetical protein